MPVHSIGNSKDGYFDNVADADNGDEKYRKNGNNNSCRIITWTIARTQWTVAEQMEASVYV